MRILGAIVAGGRSSRMGGDEKALIELEGRPLISHIISCLRPQVNQIIINANGDALRFRQFDCVVVPDPPAADGTALGGLDVVLTYAAAQGFDAVLSVPSDTPFLPHDLVKRLLGPGAAIAASLEQDHYLTGFWPVALAEVLAKACALQGMKRMQDWMVLSGARRVEWAPTPFDPFFNINTPQDLEQARMWLEERK
jgi:molybdopterin-guanine dinucleotide biosynthesis protein A